MHEGAPEQGDEVMSHMLTQLLTEAADMLLVPGVLEGTPGKTPFPLTGSSVFR